VLSDTPKSPLRRPAAALPALAAVVALALSGVAQAQGGGTSAPVVPPTTASGAPAQVFPIPGPHGYGDGFGAGRGHQGVDLFAKCGSLAVAVTAGRVVAKKFHRALGNYLIIRSKRFKRDYVYGHLAYPAAVRKKSKVLPGQFVGAVGDTGNARGCHVHFEIWRGKWYRGGRATNPMRSLRAWDVYS
jgi:murein DD-endopeptidase MepM/ murein hydrolase activator NlpD